MNHNHTLAPTCDIDFYDIGTLSDPVSVYSKMLTLGPIVWLKKNNLHAICGFSEVTESLKNHQCFSSAKGVSINDDVNQLLIGSTLNSDPPQHDETRSITFKPLSPKALNTVRNRIENEASYIVDKMVEKKEFDAAAELAPYLPLTIVRDLVGLGDYGKDNMLDWGAATFELMGNPGERRDRAVNNMQELRQYLENPETLDGLSEDGWARRATQAGIEQGMEPSRAAELMRDYIAPSLDTTISAIGFGISLFAQFPEAWDKLRANRSLLRNAIDEIVRLNTPIRAFTRFVTEPVTIDGCEIKQGSRVLIVFGAANRDPKRFSNPDLFDIERKSGGHVGFGYGVHACLGMNLARLEMSSLFGALADRVERFELTGPVVPGVNSTIYSLASVPVRVLT